MGIEQIDGLCHGAAAVDDGLTGTAAEGCTVGRAIEQAANGSSEFTFVCDLDDGVSRFENFDDIPEVAHPSAKQHSLAQGRWFDDVLALMVAAKTLADKDNVGHSQ